MTPFRRGYKITQLYGKDFIEKYINGQPIYYYKSRGFNGHEGIDLIPTDEKGNVLPFTNATDNWDVLAIEDGEVVRETDDPKSGAYGIHVVILNKQTKRAWWYCHLQSNFLALGAQVKRGDRLGHMGSTGGSTAPHLHLGLRWADENGVALNQNNGYKGFVDPKEAIESFNINSPFPIIPPPPPTIDYKALYDKEVSKTKELEKQIISLTSNNQMLGKQVKTLQEGITGIKTIINAL